MTEAISIRGVTKTFGPKTAVTDLDLAIPQGALYGFIGPNGAGKTTTIRMILSILLPDRGELQVLGHRSALEAKDRIGYLPEERGVYRKMKVVEFLAYIGRLKGLARPEAARRATNWLDRVGLGDTARKRCEELSKGMQQKVQFIAAVLHAPDLLILDEPFSGLDPVNLRLLRELVRAEHARGATVLFSTHVMALAEDLCDHVVMIHDGRKVLDDTVPAIRAHHDLRAIQLEPLDRNSDPASLAVLPGVKEIVRDGSVWNVALTAGTDPVQAMRAIVAAMAVARIELKRASLEDIFVGLVTAAPGSAGVEAARLRAGLRDGGQA